MASYTEGARVAPVRPQRARPRPQVRPKPVARPRARKRGIAGGAVWIGVVAVSLAGVVALNLAVLRLNVRLDNVAQERSKLRATNEALALQLSSSEASPRIQGLARRQLGLVPADPAATTYIDLGRLAR